MIFLQRRIFRSNKQEVRSMKYHDVDFDTYFRNYPDANGYFGKYGGSYIPPQLQAAMDEITDRLHDHLQIQQVRKRAAPHPPGVSGASHTGFAPGAPVILAGQRATVCQAGGSQPHRCAQAESLHGRSAPGQVHGQEKGYRRNRRGHNTAWRWQRQRHTSDWNATSTWAPWM